MIRLKHHYRSQKNNLTGERFLVFLEGNSEKYTAKAQETKDTGENAKEKPEAKSEAKTVKETRGFLKTVLDLGAGGLQLGTGLAATALYTPLSLTVNTARGLVAEPIKWAGGTLWSAGGGALEMVKSAFAAPLSFLNNAVRGKVREGGASFWKHTKEIASKPIDRAKEIAKNTASRSRKAIYRLFQGYETGVNTAGWGAGGLYVMANSKSRPPKLDLKSKIVGSSG